jgi:hypothetical protein
MSNGSTAPRRFDIGHDDMSEVLGALIAEAETGGMALPELAERAERAA